ncbi:nrap protein nucleotidyltransferase domain 4 domain-containing protein [Ditylenchus destructor]|uniref:Nucleolar protein 6 n=1 Tax=Ditylenchus destructor TaxID=166010 RepID=A0AAD4RB85_9BILA|nr:nrap protein nucleotidyltransferase domain 4 domain-containing protein [Ditylenchus destructor]
MSHIQHSDLEVHLKIVAAFEKLSQTLLALKGLPLSVTGVKCTSAYYRRTKPFPLNGLLVSSNHIRDKKPIQKLKKHENSPPFLPSLKVLLTLERSNKWGEDLNVINRLKGGFYVELSKILLTKQPSWLSVPLEKCLYIVLDGVVFCLNIIHNREIAMLINLEKGMLDSSQQLSKRKAFSVPLKKKFILKPLLSQQLSGLSKRCPIFSETCQLVRKWICANFLSKVFEGVALELLVANLFAGIPACPLPSTASAGFVRFISLLATHDFIAEPLIVDINNTFTPEALNKLQEDFIKKRPVLPALVLIVPEDVSGTIFTSLKPEALILKHVIKLATQLHQTFCSSSTIEFQLPMPDVTKYDILISLHGAYLSMSRQQEKNKENKITKKHWQSGRVSKSSVQSQSDGRSFPIVDYDPVKRYVKELRNSFDSVAIFFYNAYKSYAVGVMLRPSFYRSDRDPKTITGSHLRTKDRERNALIANIDALVEDFRIMGGRLIRTVIVSDHLKENAKKHD